MHNHLAYLIIPAAAAAAKSLQSCPTLCDHMDCSLLGFSIHGILQARTLEWVAISFSSAWRWKVKANFPGGSDSKVSAHNAGDPGSIPGSGRFLEKEMATHSSILAWRIPWTEDPGRLQSTGVTKSRTLSVFTFTFTVCHQEVALDVWFHLTSEYAWQRETTFPNS